MQPDNTHNPWQTHSSETRYDNPWISVRHEVVTTPGGSPGIYGVVSFKNMAIGIVPVDADGYTYLVGQYRYTLGAYSWEIPEGGGPLGIDPLLSAQRELEEETGFTADTWTSLGQIHTSNSVTDEYGHLYLATGLRAGHAAPEDTEQLEVRRLPLAEAVNMVMDGSITDSLSMAGLLKAWLLIQSNNTLPLRA